MKSTEQRRIYDGDKEATAKPVSYVPPGASPGYPGWQCRSCGKVHPKDYGPKICMEFDQAGSRICKGSLWRYIKLEVK